MAEKKIMCWRLENIATDTLVARFSSPEAAVKARNILGECKYSAVMETIVIYDRPIEFSPVHFDTEARESGLAKLSPRQRIALGLQIEVPEPS